MAAAAAATALVGLQAAGGVMKIMAGKSEAEEKMAQAQRAAEYGKIQAAQTDTAMRKNLEFTMGNIDAVRAAAGADPLSPTGASVSEYVMSNANQERETKARNRLRQVKDDENSVGTFQKLGQMSAWGSLFDTAGSILKTASGAK